MNQLMVKQFDIGISADTWILLDMFERSHDLTDPLDNTEEMAIKIAASLIQRTTELGISTGLASKAERDYFLKPDTSPNYLPRLMESLAGIHAAGKTRLEELIYDIRPQINQFNTLNIITASTSPEWIPALRSFKREGINISVIFVNPVTFGSTESIQSILNMLYLNDIRTYSVGKGESLNEALRRPLDIKNWSNHDLPAMSNLGNPSV